jgi:hypothetical protein
MTIHRENLMGALHLAIRTNQSTGKGQTAQTIGWQQVLLALENNEPVFIESKPTNTERARKHYGWDK